MEGQWRNEVHNNQLQDIGRVGSNYAPREVVALRIKLMNYLMTEEGEVPWQYEMVNRGGAVVRRQ